jgi:rod shape-determining protein MreC
MQQILKFFIQFKVGILFLVLFSMSIGLTIQSHSYHNSKWVSSTSYVSSFFFEIKYGITSYFNLKEENEALLKQNTTLQQMFILGKDTIDNQINKSDTTYKFVAGHIISNSYAKKDNFVLIDKGKNDGVFEGYGVSIPNGILGIVEKSTGNYARVISILNTNLSINAKLKNKNQFGSLQWDSQDYYSMNLNDLPRSADFKIGDTVVTGSNSMIFPEGLPIGTIKEFELNDNSGYFNIKVNLFADMTNLNQAYIILPKKIKEAKQLLNQDE